MFNQRSQGMKPLAVLFNLVVMNFVILSKSSLNINSCGHEDKEMQKKMELQLHEQYAINNNSNLSSAMVLFVAMLAVVGAYGYVYIHSDGKFVDCRNVGDLYSLNALMFTAIATIVVLLCIIYLCISFGCRQRREQFIIYAIRRKYYGYGIDFDEIFPPQYKPMDKEGLSNVQSPYDNFIRCSLIVIITVLVSSAVKGTPLFVDWGCDFIMLLVIYIFYRWKLCTEISKIRKLENYYRRYLD